MAKLTFGQIEQLWVGNGGNPALAPQMAGIALAESGGNTTSLNDDPNTGDYSVGLWQINYFNGMLNSRTAAYGAPSVLQADPNAQAKAAIDLAGSNGQGVFQNWRGDVVGAATKGGTVLSLPQVQSIAAAHNLGSTADAMDPTGIVGQVWNGFLTYGVNPVIGNAVDPGALASSTPTQSDVAKWLGIPNINWSIVGGITMAIAFILIGIYIIFRTQINEGIGDTGKAAAIA